MRYVAPRSRNQRHPKHEWPDHECHDSCETLLPRTSVWLRDCTLSDSASLCAAHSSLHIQKQSTYIHPAHSI